MLKPVSMKKIRAIIHEKYIDDTIRTLGELGAVHLIDMKDKLEKLGDKIKPIEPSEQYYRITSLFSRIERLINDLQIRKVPTTKKISVPKVLSDSFLDDLENEVKQIEEQYTKIVREIESLKEKGKTTKAESKIKDLREQLDKLARENALKLLAYHEALEIEKEVEEKKTMMGKTEKTYIFEGWVPAEEVERVTKSLLEVSEGTTIIETMGNENHEEEEEKPPTLLKNPKTLESYERLTKSFGIPSYGEIDPTLFMAISFPIFFGLMFGDIGHGLLLLIVSILGLIGKRKNLDLGEIGNYVINGAPLLFFCSIFSIFFGFLYGEFFGFSIYHEKWYIAIAPLLMPFRDLLVKIFYIFDFDAGVKMFTDPTYHEYIHPPPEGPVWFSPMHHPWVLFIISIIIGAVHLSLGLFLDIVNKFRHKEYVEAILGPGVWLWFYIGFIWIIFNKGIVFMNWFKELSFSEPAKLATNPVFFMLILPLIIMFIGRVVTEGPIEGGIGVLESLIASVSNTISYARILALNMAHEGFGKTFITLGGVNPEHGLAAITLSPMFIMSFLVGTLFIMIMEGLLSFIHTLRLHWVEWFLKFYEGEGIEFQPFTIKRYYTTTS